MREQVASITLSHLNTSKDCSDDQEDSCPINPIEESLARRSILLVVNKAKLHEDGHSNEAEEQNSLQDDADKKDFVPDFGQTPIIASARLKSSSAHLHNKSSYIRPDKELSRQALTYWR